MSHHAEHKAYSSVLVQMSHSRIMYKAFLRFFSFPFCHIVV